MHAKQNSLILTGAVFVIQSHLYYTKISSKYSKVLTTQRAHEVEMTSFLRHHDVSHSDVIMAYRRQYDIISTSAACWLLR